MTESAAPGGPPATERPASPPSPATDASARSLSSLADQVRTLSESFASDQLAGAIESIRWLILALLVIAAIGAAVPAAGALATGWWLRGWLRAADVPPPPAPASPFA